MPTTTRGIEISGKQRLKPTRTTKAKQQLLYQKYLE